MSGFRRFLLRGNVIDLAVAVVVGSAFTAIVTAIVKGFITPLIGLIGGIPDLGGLNINGFLVGDILAATLNFVIVAAVVYFFIVLPYMRLVDRFQKPSEPEKTEDPADVALLKEIRDLLRAQQGLPPATDGTGGPAGDPARA